jgi:hypothetical protein
MSRFTIKNLKEIEDSAGDRAPGIEARFARKYEVHAVAEWDVVRVSPQTVRAFEAGDDGLEIIAVGSDPPEGGDGVPADSAWVDEPEER